MKIYLEKFIVTINPEWPYKHEITDDFGIKTLATFELCPSEIKLMHEVGDVLKLETTNGKTITINTNGHVKMR